MQFCEAFMLCHCQHIACFGDRCMLVETPRPDDQVIVRHSLPCVFVKALVVLDTVLMQLFVLRLEAAAHNFTKVPLRALARPVFKGQHAEKTITVARKQNQHVGLECLLLARSGRSS